MAKRKPRITHFLWPWILVIVALSVPFSQATEIDGCWQAEDGGILFFFGPGNTFFVENETSWFQGSYTIRPDTFPGQLDLYIEDGSHGEDPDGKVCYLYDIEDNFLTLTATDPSAAFAAKNPSGRYVTIGINLDSSDEDDDDDSNFSLQASCFVRGLSQIFYEP